MKTAELTDAQSGGIKERDLGLVLGVFKMADDRRHLFPGRDLWKILVIL